MKCPHILEISHPFKNIHPYILIPPKISLSISAVRRARAHGHARAGAYTHTHTHTHTTWCKSSPSSLNTLKKNNENLNMFSSSLHSKRKLERGKWRSGCKKKAKEYKRIQSETLSGAHFILRCHFHCCPKARHHWRSIMPTQSAKELPTNLPRCPPTSSPHQRSAPPSLSS